MSEREWTGSGVDQDVVDIARGLYESRVVVKRPPSAAQRGAYRTSYRGPPKLSQERKVRPFSAKGRISTERGGKGVAYAPPSLPKPPWRPFSGKSALRRMPVNTEKTTAAVVERKEEIKDKSSTSEVPEVYKHRVLPQSVAALKEWLTDEVPSDWSKGYSPESSFVFLPCLKSLASDNKLAPVPPPHNPEDHLPYTPPPQPQKYRPPKPRLKAFAGQDESAKATNKTSSDNDSSRPSHLRMYNQTGELVHNIYQGKQTAELIRQEIKDLELLLQGIGNPDGASIVVRYQHDINHLRDMVKTTLEGYTFPKESRPLTPVAAALQSDLMTYPDRIEDILVSIRQRRDECVKELAALEQEILKSKK